MTKIAIKELIKASKERNFKAAKKTNIRTIRRTGKRKTVVASSINEIKSCLPFDLTGMDWDSD